MALRGRSSMMYDSDLLFWYTQDFYDVVLRTFRYSHYGIGTLHKLLFPGDVWIIRSIVLWIELWHHVVDGQYKGFLSKIFQKLWLEICRMEHIVITLFQHPVGHSPVLAIGCRQIKILAGSKIKDVHQPAWMLLVPHAMIHRHIVKSFDQSTLPQMNIVALRNADLCLHTVREM